MVQIVLCQLEKANFLHRVINNVCFRFQAFTAEKYLLLPLVVWVSLHIRLLLDLLANLSGHVLVTIRIELFLIHVLVLILILAQLRAVMHRELRRIVPILKAVSQQTFAISGQCIL